MCILTEEVPGTVEARNGNALIIRYIEPVRVQTGAIMRTVFHGEVDCDPDVDFRPGELVLCQVQRAGGHNAEPLLAVRKIPEL